MSKPSSAERLERLLHEPEALQAWWTPVAGRVWRTFNKDLEVRHDALQALLAELEKTARHPYTTAYRQELPRLLQQADEEFEGNLTRAELWFLAHRRVDAKHITWLYRLHALLERAQRVINERASLRKAAVRQEILALYDQRYLALEPLGSLGRGSEWKPGLLPVESLIAAAEKERDFTGRRRRLLEAAREVLLAAAHEQLEDEHKEGLSEEGPRPPQPSEQSLAHERAVQARLDHISREVALLDRLQAAGVLPDVALHHQLKQALARKEQQRLAALLSAISSQALSAGDDRTAKYSGHALDEVWGSEDRFSSDAAMHSIHNSGRETFQPEVLEALQRGVQQGLHDLQVEQQEAPPERQAYITTAQAYLNDNAAEQLIAASLFVDACVDVGGTLSPHRVTEFDRVQRQVRYPTQKLLLSQAETVDDLAHSVVNDPRSILLDLAAGKLLTRRFVSEEQVAQHKQLQMREARVYLLDGSSSMLGPRARLRDAILVAELSAMIARLNNQHRTLTPTLYFRYFDTQTGPLTTVKTAEQATQAIEDVVKTVRFGGTNIQDALLTSFETLKQAQTDDPELARAQIVLITDGESRLDTQELVRKRAQLGSLPVGVSIIALGEENSRLKQFSRYQRQRGQRIFYQYIDDPTIERLVQRGGDALPLHLPKALANRPPSEQLAQLVEEIATALSARDLEAMDQLREEAVARSEVELTDADLSAAERARIHSLTRNQESLGAQFDRWFPAASADAELTPRALVPSETDAEKLRVVNALLESVAEVLTLVDSDGHARQWDAIELFEHLLHEERIDAVAYLRLCELYPRQLAKRLAQIRNAAGH